jgi:cytoskeletal protein CcmA (bactofilin family)
VQLTEPASREATFSVLVGGLLGQCGPVIVMTTTAGSLMTFREVSDDRIERARNQNDRHPLVVAGELTLRGRQRRDIVVEAGGVLWIRGTVSGDVLVLTGGRAHVQGQVDGDVSVSGRLTVRGTISGTLTVLADGSVRTPGEHASIAGGIVDKGELARKPDHANEGVAVR